MRPTKLKHSTVWDVKTVFNYLLGLYPVEPTSHKELTYNVIMLMLLVSGQRSQTIHLLNLRNMYESINKLNFLIRQCQAK